MAETKTSATNDVKKTTVSTAPTKPQTTNDKSTVAKKSAPAPAKSTEPVVDIKTETMPDGNLLTIKTVYYPGVNGQPGKRVITRTVTKKKTTTSTVVTTKTQSPSQKDEPAKAETPKEESKFVVKESKVQPEKVNVQKQPKPQKEENGLVKFFKNKFVLFVLLGLIMAVSAFFLLLADKENFVRKAIGLDGVPFFQTIGKIFGMGEPLNVDITSWLILIGFWFLVFAVLGIIWLRKTAKEKYAIKHHINIETADKKAFTKFNVLYFVIFILIIAIPLVCLFTFFPYDAMMAGLQSAKEPLVNVFKSTGLFIIMLLIIPACIAAIILIFKLFVFLLTLLIGNVSKNVMSSQNYQEAYSASQLAAAKIKQEVEEEAKRREEEKRKAEEEAQKKKETKKESDTGTVGGGTGAGLAAAGFGNTTLGGHQKNMFPALTKIDISLGRKKEKPEGSTKGKGNSVPNDKIDLVHLANGFQSYLANRKNLYYDLNMLRGFISGIACSRLLLLQGLSGTGKSTLPREFAEYTSNSTTFYPVQATWRDKSDLVGYFSDFTGEYKETELLKTLYRANYTPKTIYMLVLDEANISRMEYYFADFLSIYEYPSSNWLISLIQPRKDDKLPARLEEGKVRIPVNTWFVATVNIDDSTFTISDKVYDRAMVLDFSALNEPIKTKYDDSPYPINKTQFDEAVKKAQSTAKNCLTPAEKAKFMKLIYFVGDTFDVKIGNRIMNQINNFVPVFVACGGLKDSALDVMFANKVLRKVDSLFESYVEDGLTRLNKLVVSTYGAKNFPLTLKTIAKLKKKFN